MSVVNIDQILGRPMNRVYRVGIEVEGGWLKPPETDNVIRDGSVVGLTGPKDPKTGFTAPLTIGEIASEPLEPIRIASWMKRCYPSHVNKTCGLHVHMSFRSARHYQWLMDSEDYQDTMLAYLKKWGEDEKIDRKSTLWDRLAGKSEYCKHEFFPDAQAARNRKIYEHEGHGNRYTAINYCFGLHETIECRVLPMFEDVAVGISAVRRVLSVTNAYLMLAAKKDEKLKVEVSGSEKPQSADSWVHYV